MTLNYDKCKFFTSNIKFLGHIISDKGISPDLKKVQAIRSLTATTNISELRCFLGMINQLSKFLPHLASKSSVLRELLKKTNQWYWRSCQQGCFEELKIELDSNCLLARYEPEYPTIVSADASSYGLAGVLRQQQSNGDWLPIAYMSRSLTETEKRYAQIEKEALVVTCACERLSDYSAGNHFEIETDHKPLVPLLSSKNLEELPLRVQRFRLRLIRFSFSVRHVSG